MRAVVAFVTILYLSDLVACLSEGTNMVGVNCENLLVTRNRVDGRWFDTTDTCCIEAIAVNREDNTLLGVFNKRLYTKKSPNLGQWEGPIENSCCVRDVAMMYKEDDFTILATTTEDKLVFRPDLNSEWQKVTNSYGVRSIDVYQNGKILGVSKDGALKRRQRVKNSEWEYMSGGGGRGVRDIAIQPNGTVFGIGKSTKGIYTLDDEFKWGDFHENSACVISIVSTGNMNG
ncbi:uncharacterized protein LOC144454031 [Glandiceps talaboti]